jgi:hypothetical protein
MKKKQMITIMKMKQELAVWKQKLKLKVVEVEEDVVLLPELREQVRLSAVYQAIAAQPVVELVKITISSSETL